MCYAKMPKAASSSIHSALNRLYPNCRTLKGPDRVPASAPSGALFITSAREPWSRIVAGIIDINSDRNRIGGNRRRWWRKTGVGVGMMIFMMIFMGQKEMMIFMLISMAIVTVIVIFIAVATATV